MTNYSNKGWSQSLRGASSVFGQDVVRTICQILGVDLIARAHQVRHFIYHLIIYKSVTLKVVQDGYEFSANRHLVTIFSAPHYAAQYNNSGATMSVDEDLMCSFNVYRPE